MGKKSIWDCHITLHSSIKEKMNSVLLSLAREKECQKSRIIQELIETHPDYEKKLGEMEKEDFFI